MGERTASVVTVSDRVSAGEAEDRFRVADRVTAGDRAPGLVDHLRRGLENGDDRLAGKLLRKGSNVDRDHHSAAHRKDVGAGIGGGNRPEVSRMIDEWR